MGGLRKSAVFVALFIAGSAFAPAPARSEYKISTAASLADVCLRTSEIAAENTATYLYCTAYVRATFELLFAEAVREGKDPSLCLPEDQSIIDMVEEVIRYLRQYSTEEERLATDIVYEALLESPAGCFLVDQSEP